MFLSLVSKLWVFTLRLSFFAVSGSVKLVLVNVSCVLWILRGNVHNYKTQSSETHIYYLKKSSLFSFSYHLLLFFYYLWCKIVLWVCCFTLQYLTMEIHVEWLHFRYWTSCRVAIFCGLMNTLKWILTYNLMPILSTTMSCSYNNWMFLLNFIVILYECIC